MKILVRDYERAIVHRDGRPTEWLVPGRHRRYGLWTQLEVMQLDLRLGYVAATPELEALIPKEGYRVLEVPVQHHAVLEVDGLPTRALGPGRYLLWKLRERVEATLYDLRTLKLKVPEHHAFYLMSQVDQVRVKPGTAELVYVDGALEAVLQTGLHTLAAINRRVETQTVDLRLQERAITGQEVMTKDHVTLRLNVTAQYLVHDPAQVARAVPVLTDALHTEIQLATRRMVAGLTVDELLTQRVHATATMTEEVRAATQDWGVTVKAVDIKDVVLPGDMKALLNRVIEAEKQAAAQVILRREETAATRSMANTARLLDQNPVLLRLKELEAMRDLADRVGHLTVVTGVPDWAKGALSRAEPVSK